MATEAVIQTLQALWKILRQNRIPAALVGGLALAVWRYPRATRDVDVLIQVDEAQLEQLAMQLRSVGFREKRADPIDLGPSKVWQFLYEPVDCFVDVQVDLLAAQSNFTRQALARSITLTSESLGTELQVLGCEDLILMKLLAGRIIDRADAVALWRQNRSACDQQLISRLANELRLSDALDDIRREAEID